MTTTIAPQKALLLVLVLSLICMGLRSSCGCDQKKDLTKDPVFQPGAIRFARPTK